MAESDKSPSLADLAKAQIARQEAEKARRDEIARASKVEEQNRREKWDAAVAEARDCVTAINNELSDTGIVVEFSSTPYQDKSFHFGEFSAILHRSRGSFGREKITFKCSTAGYINLQSVIAHKQKKEMPDIYLEDLDGGEVSAEIRAFLAAAFSD